MKRLVALRKLQRKCIDCDCCFNKGDIYYKERNVEADGVDVWAYEQLHCPRCLYKNKCHRKRFERFKLICNHPRTHTEYDYISGEAVMEPSHNECDFCLAIL